MAQIPDESLSDSPSDSAILKKKMLLSRETLNGIYFTGRKNLLLQLFMHVNLFI